MAQVAVSNPISLEERDADLTSKYQKEPFRTIIPADFKKKKAKGAVVIDETFVYRVPNADEIEATVVGIIGCIPEVGPIAQGLWTMMSGRIKREEEKITPTRAKEIIAERIKKFKQNLERLADEKINDSERAQYKSNCDKMFRGFVESSFELLMSDLNLLKSKFIRNKPVDPEGSFLIGLRSKMDRFRSSIKALLPFYEDPRFIKDVADQYMELLFLHNLVLLNLDTYWYQYGYDQDYALGVPKTAKFKGVHSFKQKVHNNIVRATKAFQIGYSNYDDVESLPKNIPKLLELDPILYPYPIVKAKADDDLSTDNQFTIPSRDTPFIFRIDANNAMRVGDKYCGYKTQPYIRDPITGCYGAWIDSSGSLNLKSDKTVLLKLRLYGTFNGTINFGLSYPFGDKFENKDVEEMGATSFMDSTHFHQTGYRDLTSGIVETKGFVEFDSEQFQYPIRMSSSRQDCRIYFIDLIVMDKNFGITGREPSMGMNMIG
ncbi:hypothetical protein RB653_009839 [Dictyostelium firmibasis]|uniref:Pesticidal crystal protein N-terminal domain-containing protein n=1 Tax=Dictyostelium firmibasis TaxID=79012 RepID=A0AAN7TR39_9MYCE